MTFDHNLVLKTLLQLLLIIKLLAYDLLAQLPQAVCLDSVLGIWFDRFLVRVRNMAVLYVGSIMLWTMLACLDKGL